MKCLKRDEWKEKSVDDICIIHRTKYDVLLTRVMFRSHAAAAIAPSSSETRVTVITTEPLGWPKTGFMEQC